MNSVEKVRALAHLPAGDDLIMAVTGHRPPKLGGYNVQTEGRGLELAMKMLGWYKPDHVLTGMALGWDTSVAEACVDTDTPWTACIPFPGQEERWPAPQQYRYHELMEKATHVVAVCPKWHRDAMNTRNAFMVNRCNVLIALWNGMEAGGTWHAVHYAEVRKVYTINLWATYCNRRTQ